MGRRWTLCQFFSSFNFHVFVPNSWDLYDFPFFQFGTWTIGRTCFFLVQFSTCQLIFFNIIIQILGSSRKPGNLIGFCAFRVSGTTASDFREENMFEPLPPPPRKPKNGKLENLPMFNSWDASRLIHGWFSSQSFVRFLGRTLPETNVSPQNGWLED